MAASVPVQKHKLPPGQLPDEWSTREKLILASSVVRSGDQNWVSVSRAIKPVVETGCCARPRPPDFFSQKNCAMHYSEMLEKVSTPKRKRTNEGGGGETPGDQIVRKLTYERIEELKKSVKNDQHLFRKLKDRIEDIRNGKLDHQLPSLWNEIKIRKKMRPPPVPQPEGDGSAPITPTTPTTPVTPTTPGAQQEAALKPQAYPTPASQQKGKQLRVPKPTAKFQKYQQLLHQRHGSHTNQSSPLNQTPEGFPVTPEKGLGELGSVSVDLQGGQLGGLGQAASLPARTQFSKGEPMDVDLASSVPAGTRDAGAALPPQSSPRRSDSVPQSPLRQQLTPQASLVTSQGSSESALVSLLSLPPSQDSKLNRSGSDQEMFSAKDGERRLSLGGQPPQGFSPNSSPHSASSQQSSSQTINSENSDSKHFLGVAPSMEPKKLDSMREIQGSTTQAEAPSVSAPTLSKLLADTSVSTATGGGTPSSLNSVPSHSPVAKSPHSGMEPSALVDSPAVSAVDHSVSVVGGGRGLVGGGPAVLTVSTTVPPISVNPKAALTATLPSPMAITPPPTTPPADRKELIAVQKFEPAIRNSEKTSGSVIASETLENEATATAEPVPIPEVKVEAVDSPVPSPRVTKRSFKPGRPGRPPKGARRNQRNRSKSATSTDNEGDVDEEREEETRYETLDVESEKASEKTEDEDDGDSTADDKKEESDENMEMESADEGMSESGERSQSERDEPGTSMKDLLLERAGLASSESFPGSPSSQMSQGSSDEQEAIQAQKTWKKSIMLVWRAAANHKYANVFLHPVTDDEAPGYHSVVFRPMDLSSIKKSIENGTIRTTSEFQRDMMLMFQNALMYNSADHDVYRMAEEMRDDVMEQIQSYIATQIMVDSKMLRGHRQDVFHIFL